MTFEIQRQVSYKQTNLSIHFDVTIMTALEPVVGFPLQELLITVSTIKRSVCSTLFAEKPMKYGITKTCSLLFLKLPECSNARVRL